IYNPAGFILNAEILKREKKKNFRKFLEVQKRFLPLQSQRKRREKQNDKEGRNACRNIADTEVEASKVL
ncbi:hypothetical protein, partial [Sphingobacterium sp. Ag1]|uniref:hypothetical protein n=1 Tax=Sphingobacterium sp. Ag1 TaxID=1643451 RepID=UPI000B2A75FB